MTRQLHLDGREQSERVCACGCGMSLDGMRRDAIWLSRAHAVRWARANPGKSLREAHSANKGRTRTRSRPSGAQGSLGKIRRSMELLVIRVAPDLPPAKADRLVKVHSLYTLSERQRALLEQREAA